MKTRLIVWGAASALVAAAAAGGATINVVTVAQLACPLSVTKAAAVYGPMGAKYKPSFYAVTNPGKKDELWMAVDFQNGGDDVITKFTFDVLAWDAAGKELFKTQGVYDFALRDKPASKEWNWDVPDGGTIATVIFIPRVISLPGGRTWEANDDFVNGKLAELKKSK